MSEFYPLLNKFGCGDEESNSGCESVKSYTNKHTVASVTCVKPMPRTGIEDK